MLCFTYFQVMPEFVDFLFPFGFQEFPKDFFFSGFRQRTQLAERQLDFSCSRPTIAEIQLCYNLKSVEPSDSDEWSIRHCAVYHSFDMKEVRASWIIVKGDKLMKKRIESLARQRGSREASSFQLTNRAFEASLETHLVFCDWSAESWRWYINSLEDKFQNLTRKTLSAPVRVPTSPSGDTDGFTMNPRTNTQRTDKSIFSFFSEAGKTEKGSLSQIVEQPVPSPQTYTNPSTGVSQPLPPDETDDDEPETMLKPTHSKTEDQDQNFSFSKYRKVHFIAEKANEAVLVLKQNSNVLTQLKKYYRSISRINDFPKNLGNNCDSAVASFELRIEGLENDIQTQLLRLETLMRLLEDRKALVNQIIQLGKSAKLRQNQLRSVLEYQNTQANKVSTQNMVGMTEDMNDIALKTKIETVSMKVITLVTLFFLPGTFIAVGRAFLSVSFDLVKNLNTTAISFTSLLICTSQLEIDLNLTESFRYRLL